MREMKDSGVDWIGSIPDSWQVVPFRSYAEMRREKNKGEKTRELLALSFALGVTLYRDKVYNMDRVKEDYEDYQIVYENDLVLSPNDIIKGSVYVSKYYGCISPMYLVFSARDKKCHHLPYLSYLLRTQEAGRKFFFIARGLIGDILENGKYVTRRMSVSKQDLLSFKVLLPSFTEQQRITEFLDRKCAEVDEMIALQEQIIEELKAYKQSVITEAVTKGLNPDVPMKDSGIEWIGNIPEHWRVGKIKMIAKTNSGSTPKTISQTEESSIIWIRTTDINDNLVTDSSLHLTQEELNSASCPMLNKDVCVVAMYGGGGTIGKCGILGVEATINQALCSIEVKSFHFGAFMFWTLRATRYNWMKFAVGTRKDPNISQEIVKNYIVPIPPLNEQQKISEYLNTKCTEIDNLISIKLSKIDSLKEYKKSIIYEYVTGKREVE